MPSCFTGGALFHCATTWCASLTGAVTSFGNKPCVLSSKAFVFDSVFEKLKMWVGSMSSSSRS